MALTLFKAIIKCLGKNYTLLIVSNAAANSTLCFFVITRTTCGNWSVTGYLLTELLHWWAIEPLGNGHVSNVIPGRVCV
jgi:hypothetical protein